MIEGYLFLMSRPNCSHIFSFEHSKKRNGLGRSEKCRWKKIEANSWWGYLCLKTAQASPRCSGALSSEWMQLFTEKCLIQYGNSLDTCKFMLSRQSIHCKHRRCATQYSLRLTRTGNWEVCCAAMQIESFRVCAVLKISNNTRELPQVCTLADSSLTEGPCHCIYFIQV